jgi:hypothetical protein
MSIRKILVSAAVTVLGVVGVMNVAIADAPSRVTVCVESNGQGSPDHAVTIPAHAADAPAFGGSCGASYGGGFGGRVSAADTNDELAETR